MAPSPDPSLSAAHPSVSVIVPTRRQDEWAEESIRSICESIARYPGAKEFILCIDRPYLSRDNIVEIAREYDFVTTLCNPGPKGSAYIRHLGIQTARNDVLVFSDDDCLVPPTWVGDLVRKVEAHGLVAGNLVRWNKTGWISKLEECVDQYRIHASDRQGRIKYISFPNFAIRKEILPVLPFDVSPLNTTEDMDLACRLRLSGRDIHFSESIQVQVLYSNEFWEVVKRKIKHGRGMAYLHRRLGDSGWKNLEIGSLLRMLLRWTGLSFSNDLNILQKIVYYFFNLIYCLSVQFYYLRFIQVEPIDWEELDHGLS